MVGALVTDLAVVAVVAVVAAAAAAAAEATHFGFGSIAGHSPGRATTV